MALYKEGDANTVAVAKRVQAKIKQLQDELPENAELKILSNQVITTPQGVKTPPYRTTSPPKPTWLWSLGALPQA
jgi:hypothetical protein